MSDPNPPGVLSGMDLPEAVYQALVVALGHEDLGEVLADLEAPAGAVLELEHVERWLVMQLRIVLGSICDEVVEGSPEDLGHALEWARELQQLRMALDATEQAVSIWPPRR